MSFVRAEEVKSVLRFIAAGTCVSVVGPDGSGRTTLLREVTAMLDERGYETLSVAGIETLRSRPFEALELAGALTRTASPPSIGATVTALAEMASTRRFVILVDDAHFVDDQSWGVLAAVHARTGVVIVTTSRDGRGGEARKRLNAIVTHAAEVRLRPLSYEAVSDLIHERLGRSVDTSVVGRIYIKSAGLPSLVSSVTSIAAGVGRLELVDGTWVAVGELWDPAMAGSVEHLLAGLSEADVEAVEMLSLAGALDIDSAIELVGHDQVESLESRSLLLGIAPFGRQAVTITPPLIAEYFHNGPASLRRGRLLQRIHELYDHGDDSGRAMIGHIDSGERLSTPDAEETAMLRLIRERHGAQLATRRHAWEVSPSVATALDYLWVLLDGQHDRARVLSVFAAVDENTGGAAAVAELRVLKARWLAIEMGDLEAALRTLKDVPAYLTTYQGLFDAYVLYLTMLVDRVPDNLDELVVEFDREQPAAVAALVAALVVAGRPRTALRIIGTTRIDSSTRMGRVLLLHKGWALLASGDARTAYSWAMSHREHSRAELDIEVFREHSYVAALASIVLGRYHDADRLLGTALALGDPGLGQERTYMGTLAVSAVLAARNGRVASSRSLTRQAGTGSLSYGPWPGMVANLPSVVLSIIEGDLDGGRKALAEHVRYLADRGYLFAAGSLTFLAQELYDADVPADPLAERIAEQLEGDLLSPLLSLQAAMRSGDVDELVRLGEWFREQERLAPAMEAFEAAAAAVDDLDALEAARLRELVAAVASKRNPADVSTLNWRVSAQRVLSARELEVARLAAGGLTNQEIAVMLTISARTVESHVSKVFRKLGLASRAELAGIPWL